MKNTFTLSMLICVCDIYVILRNKMNLTTEWQMPAFTTLKKVNHVTKFLSFIKHAQSYLHDSEDKSSRFLQSQ
jgi:hypothetical protein